MKDENMNSKKRIGFIGLGLMGSGMAMNIMKKHGQLNVFDLDKVAVAQLVASGATQMQSAKELGANSDVVVLSLPEPSISLAVVLGKEG